MTLEELEKDLEFKRQWYQMLGHVDNCKLSEMESMKFRVQYLQALVEYLNAARILRHHVVGTMPPELLSTTKD